MLSDRHVTVDLGTLPVAASVTITFRVDYRDAPPAVTSTTNQATVASDEVPPVRSDDPTRPGVADPTVRPVPRRGPGGSGAGPSLAGCEPGDGATITAPTVIGCTLVPRAGTSVGDWVVSLQPAGRPAAEAVQVATGRGGTVSAAVDPTLLANGIWEVRITAADSGGGVSVLGSSVVVDGQLKLGRYQLSFQDLAVPVAGLPVRVLRTYDTLTRNRVGDFGHGWGLEVATFRADHPLPALAGGETHPHDRGRRSGQQWHHALPLRRRAAADPH